MCELAELYLSGELGEKNTEEAYNLFKRAAEKGNSHAMCKISQLYESGDLGTPNQELADEWLKKAADKKNVYALAVTGQRSLNKYQEEYYVKSNTSTSSALKQDILRYLNTAANRGSTRGIWQLGNIYEEGLLGEEDLSKAIEYYVKAAKLASPSSLESLYYMTLNCSFSVKELEEILDHVSSFLPTTSIGMALQLGEEQVIGNLGYNPVRGLKMVEQAAFKKYDQAVLKLAECYRDGIGCDVDLKLAQYWFIKLHKLYDVSSRAGNVASLWNLGELYLNGNFNNIDLQKAVMCFKKAIEISSDPDQIYNLGVLYLRGQLGDKPIDIGIKLIAQGIKIWQHKARSGITSIYYNLGRAYYFINNEKNAVYWLSKAPSTDIEAHLYLAKIYLDNLSPEKNISLGLKILENLILELGICHSEAFDTVGFTIDKQTILWLQQIANNITEPIANKNSNQYIFQEFVISTLAKIYETGELVEVSHDLSAKYYNQLFINYKSIKAGNKLVWIYNDQHLPAEYYDTVNNWILQIPVLLETGQISWIDFMDCVVLLAEMYKKGNILPCDVLQATKWLYLALYYYSSDEEAKQKHIKCQLSELPSLEYNQKVQIVSELAELTKHNKMTAPLNYKVMSRVLGDIYDDDKIVNQNTEESIYWYTESANANNALASFKLAEIYQYNKKDINTSINWYKLSAQQGNKDAIKVLLQLAEQKEHNILYPFLYKYQHRSLVPDAELANVKPFKNLDFYPKTIEQMFELGKSYSNLRGRDNILNAAFWFRKAMEKDSIDAALELCSMFRSGKLGMNLVPCAEMLYPDILKICYSKLRLSIVSQGQDIPSTLSLLTNVSSALGVSDMITADTLALKIEALFNQTHLINTERLAEITADLESIKLELYTKSPTSHAVDVCLLAGEISDELNL